MESTDRWTETISKKRHNWLLFFMFLLGLGLRLYGYEWGFPHHFHPDERQIVDFQAPQVDLSILNPSKSFPLLVQGDWNGLNKMLFGMNTKFFAYGPLPMYTLAIVVEIQDAINHKIRSYTATLTGLSPEIRSKINTCFPRVKDGKGRIITGRVISALLSALTILVVFRIGSYLYNVKVGYMAAALFTFTVLSIQQAHFMIVDGPQTFLVAWAMYYVVRIAMGDRRRDYYLAAILIGMAMATKFSTAPIGLAYILAHVLSVTRGRRQGDGNWFHWIAGGLLAIAVMTVIMPFWILDSTEFFRDIREQRDMVTGVADLPYTIQFENTAPFVNMIRNMIVWSMGLPLGLAAWIGLIAAIRRMWKKPEDLGNMVMLAFVLPLLYFNGTFYAKFLRYTLVTMPFFVIFAARWLYGMNAWAGRNWARITATGVLLGTIVWAAAFQSIYLDPHTRLQASDWIYENLEKGKHVVQESGWDDGLPVSTENGDPNRYTIRQLGIYKEPDNEQRAAAMAEILEWGDIVVLSSRKHYGSVTRVPNRYPVSTNFYKLLFDERLGYQHVRTYDNPPALWRWKFRDDTADESFRVYEHPRVDIFVKESALSAARIQALLMAPPPETADMTYHELMTRRPPTETGSRVNFPILKWLLALQLLGIICIPFSFVVFEKFEHKGYPFCKLFGLLLTGFVCWLLPGLRWFPFSKTLIFGVIIALGWLSHFVYRMNRDAIRKMVRERWWSIAGYEILFLAIFSIFGLLKSYNPDIFWSESSMDFGFMNAVLRAEYFPPEDPWIQGQGVNYYYYGHYLAAFMTRLTGVEPSYGYNLFFITIPSLVALTIAAVLITLTRRIWVALIGVLFAIFIGNLDGLPQMANIWVRSARGTDWMKYADFFQSAVGKVLHLGRQDPHFRFFRSAHELIKPTVHEFPFWSYNFMDLHAHTIATMLSTFFLALQFVLLRNGKAGIRFFGDNKLQRILTLVILWITYGAMISTNSWDIPTQMLFMIMVSLWIMVFANRKPKAILMKSVSFPIASDSDHSISSGESMSTGETGVEHAGTRDDAFGEKRDARQDLQEDVLDATMVEPAGLEPQQSSDGGGEIAADSSGDGEEAERGPASGDVLAAAGKADYQDEFDEPLTSLPGGESLLTEQDLPKPVVPIIRAVPIERTSFGQTIASAITRIRNWIVDEVSDSVVFLWKLLWPVALVVIGAMAFHLPYLMHFHRAGMGIGTLWKHRQTTNLDGFLTMFGFFIFILITQFIRWWWDVQKTAGCSALKSLCILLSLIVLLTGIWAGFLHFPQKPADFSVLMISLFLMILILWIMLRGYPTNTETFPLLLALTAVGITAGCEVFFIRDFYQGSDMRRFNTIFKFYLQAWFMFSIASAYLIARRTRIRAQSPNLRQNLVLFRRLASWSWTIVFLFLLGGSLIFTVWGVYARHFHDEYRRVKLPLTLDGWAYLKNGLRKDVVNEYRAINWLQQNIKGTPVILEASGADYLYQFGDISANTGLPTVLGWWSHVDQREYLVKRNRGKNREDRKIDTGKIKRDILTMYESADIETVLSLMGQYRIQYVFVGPTEKAEYNELGLEKFKQMSAFMTPVYSNPDVVIYRVNDYGHNLDLVDSIQDTEALTRLKEELQAREMEQQENQKAAELERERRMQQQQPRSLLMGIQGKARGMFEEPRSLCVAPDGSVYVADFRNHRVQKYNADGTWAFAWGESGDEPGKFNDICDVAANTRFVYVLDTFHNRIQTFNHEGKLEKIIVPESYTVSHPRGIAADETSIYLCDTGNSRVIKMDLQGQNPKIIGRAGKGQVQFGNPVGIAVRGKELFIADTNNQRVQVISTEGEYLREYPVEGWMAEVFNEPYIAVGQNETIWYSDPTRSCVHHIDAQGRLIRKYTQASDGKALGLPMGLAIMLNGDVLVVDARNHNVMQIAAGAAQKSAPPGTKGLSSPPAASGAVIRPN